MSRRITREEGQEKYEHLLECRELEKKGIKPKYGRAEKKRRARMSKSKRFVEMLKDRGGFYKQKEES